MVWASCRRLGITSKSCSINGTTEGRRLCQVGDYIEMSASACVRNAWKDLFVVKRHTRSGRREAQPLVHGRGEGGWQAGAAYSATGRSRPQEMSCHQAIALFPLEAFKGRWVAASGPISPPLSPYPHQHR